MGDNFGWKAMAAVMVKRLFGHAGRISFRSAKSVKATPPFRELIAFLGEDVFDQRSKDGAIAKSDAFQRRISDARSVLRLIGAYDEASANEKTFR